LGGGSLVNWSCCGGGGRRQGLTELGVDLHDQDHLRVTPLHLEENKEVPTRKLTER
jgi:hypothetical protein